MKNYDKLFYIIKPVINQLNPNSKRLNKSSETAILRWNVAYFIRGKSKRPETSIFSNLCMYFTVFKDKNSFVFK